MSTPLRVLILEDQVHDTELIVRELQRAGFVSTWVRVDNEKDYLDKLDPGLDLIISDYRMPGFDAMRALELHNQRGLDIPFILVSGTIGEETAVAAIHQGASDYVMKDRLGRLGSAVTQAMERRYLCQQQSLIAKALRESEERYRLLFESGPMPMWIFDSETLRYLAVNEAAIQQYGYTREEFLTMTIKDLQPAEDVASVLEFLASSPSGNLGIWHHRKRDGTIFEAEIISNMITVGGRRVRFGLSHDVTERKRSEEERRQSEERFRATFEQAATGIAHVSPQGRWLRVNQKLCDILGYPREDMLGLTFQDITHPEDLEENQALRQKLLEGTMESCSTEKRYLRADGTWLWAKATISLVHEAKGQPTYFITVVEDISERKLAEQQIHEQASLIDLANDAIVVRDLEDRVRFWNRRAESLYGWTAAEVMGRKTTDLIYPNPSEFDNARKHLLAQGNWSGELTQISRDGKRHIVDARWTLLRNESGEPGSVLAINTDITDKKQLEEQFLRAQRLESIGTLASGVAHDLNNILSPILMSAAMLRENLDPDMRERIISTIEESTQRGAEIVKQVLTFTRGAQGERIPLQPRHLVREIEGIMRQTFPKSIVVVNRFARDLWTIHGDPTQIHQVLLNLCINARDAMLDGGKLTLSAENADLDDGQAAMFHNARAGLYVALQVSDTGMGIPAGIIDRIFDPFFTTKELGKGTGLGLSTVIGIVKGHGGFVHVNSEPGKGSSFKIFFPASREPEAASQQLEAAKTPTGHGEVILVVDDEADIRGMLETVLSRQGYTVLTAKDGNEALRTYALQAGTVKLVLTDVMMPWVDGVVLTRALKKFDPHVKVIASTGQPEISRLNELKALGVKGLLRKPYNSEKLLFKVNAVLHGKTFETDFSP